MGNLALVKSEPFGAVQCDFYNDGKEFWMTRRQIGEALEYSDPQKAIDNIHIKRRERLDPYSVTLKVRGTDGKLYNTLLYSPKGVYEICRWSQQPKANAFFDWVYDMLEALRTGSMTVPVAAISELRARVAALEERLPPLRSASAPHTAEFPPVLIVRSRKPIQPEAVQTALQRERACQAIIALKNQPNRSTLIKLCVEKQAGLLGLSTRQLYNLVAKYEQGGLSSLIRQERSDAGQHVNVCEAGLEIIKRLYHREKPSKASVLQKNGGHRGHPIGKILLHELPVSHGLRLAPSPRHPAGVRKNILPNLG